MQTLLLTLNSQARNVDLELPAEVPLRTLLPALLQMNAREAGIVINSGQWGLWSSTTRQRLDPDRSLLEAGIIDGEVLYLQHGADPSQLPSAPEAAFTPKTIRPDANSGGIGVRWRKPQ